MNDTPFPDTDPQDDDDNKFIVFVLPQYVSPMGFSCSREWTENKNQYETFACGCPRCLKKFGLCLCFHQADWNESGDMQEHWRKRIVSVKTASYAAHLICPGYEP